MTNLVRRLRTLAERERPYGSLPDTLEEAAARIEQLEAALRKITDRLEDDFNDGRSMRRYELDNARAALKERT